MNTREKWTFGFRVHLQDGTFFTESVEASLGGHAVAWTVVTKRLKERNKKDSSFLVQVKSVERVR